MIGADTRRPPWWRELSLVAGVYGIYSLTRNTLPVHVATARANALDLYDSERHLHLDIERSVNDFMAAPSAHPLAVFANYTYSVSHFAVTLSVLLWLYLSRPDVYRRARWVLLITTLVGLLGFWLYPLAPPRVFPDLGFVDTVVRDRTWGSWSSTTITRISNQYAAMPSIHLAWSVWSASALLRWARQRWVRIAACVYPVLIAFVIVGTANHWTLDACGGLAAVAVGTLLSTATIRIRSRFAGGSRRSASRRAYSSS